MVLLTIRRRMQSIKPLLQCFPSPSFRNRWTAPSAQRWLGIPRRELSLAGHATGEHDLWLPPYS